MNFEINPFVRYVAKTSYCLEGKNVIAKDCRLIYVLSGGGTITVCGVDYVLKNGACIYFPYGIEYKICSDGKLFFYVLNFDFNMDNCNRKTIGPVDVALYKNDAIESIDCVNKADFSNCIYLENAGWAEQYLRNIYNENSEKKAGYIYSQSGNLRSILINIYRDKNNETQKNELCDTIKKYIEENCAVNNKEIAEMLNYHPYYIGEVFKKNEGITLHQYIMRKRLAKAYELVLVSRMSIEDIAFVCGFSSQAHLSTLFKKEYGVAPGGMRRHI